MSTSDDRWTCPLCRYTVLVSVIPHDKRQARLAHERDRHTCNWRRMVAPS